MATAIIGLILVAFILMSLRSYIRKLRVGCCGGGDARSIRPGDTHASHYPCHIALRVGGMRCTSCARRVENIFNSRPGMMARVNLSAGRADIYTKEPLSEAEAGAMIARAGYEASAWEQARR